jgi:1-deoxy-D-xylulose-5-phosphate reductoisomerase
MNKGLELIEAFHLFPLAPEAFESVIHPQSVVHSLVEYVDGSVLAQLGSPDMRIPIAYTLAWPERMETPCERLDLVRTASLSFAAPDPERFPALGRARQALCEGGARPAVLNAANEVAVGAFLDGAIDFLDIASIAAETLQCYAPPAPQSVEEVLDVDREARAAAEDIVKRVMR